ncbi:hypothetical protein AMATHDRAFT_158699 [Amanita thiersii Skay4041]|uniref:Carboxypeptidase n=1 Tax=Amanita thiersii Skay4041 TaxID=703135 RepID=A0A2A9NBD1_9AGAR|nr:hypothetical protein AMATHDRAFT_158699 [Amanita thiersii Skay4041]
MLWSQQLVLLLSGLIIGSATASNPYLFASGKRFNQKPPTSYALYENYDAGLFTPLGDLSAMSDDTYTLLTHPAFPSHSVRIKKSDFCDGTVNAYTGYIDVEARHLFFYFFESRNDPDKDDVIFWTNGGPGCSSSTGLFMELGPCRVLDEDGPKFHPESWNTHANIFFVDQPIGVGFSYAEHGESVSTTEEAAKDIASFVAVFFEHFHKFKGRPFHMAGESYGGRYLPLFASAVYDQNAIMVAAGMTPINLTSVMIGNGLTDYAAMLLSYYEAGCTSRTLPPILDISTCVKMRQMVPRCKKWIKEACIDVFDVISCSAAVNTCQIELLGPFYLTGLDPYDMSRKCEGESESHECYSVSKYIDEYLDRPSVRAQLGVDPSLSGKNFTGCNLSINSAFINTHDFYHQTQHYISALLDHGVKVLIYVGTYDWVCNWIGNERWTLDLEWSGSAEFVKKDLTEWFVDGKRAGWVRHSGLFTFATIEGAGHLVPYNKPVQSLAMVQRWLAGEEL